MFQPHLNDILYDLPPNAAFPLVLKLEENFLLRHVFIHSNEKNQFLMQFFFFEKKKKEILMQPTLSKDSSSLFFSPAKTSTHPENEMRFFLNDVSIAEFQCGDKTFQKSLRPLYVFFFFPPFFFISGGKNSSGFHLNR